MLPIVFRISGSFARNDMKAFRHHERDRKKLCEQRIVIKSKIYEDAVSQVQEKQQDGKQGQSCIDLLKSNCNHFLTD